MKQPVEKTATDPAARPAQIDDPGQLTIGKRLRFLLKDTILYGGAAAFNKAFALITFPLLARHFSVEAYGTIDFFNVLAALLLVLFVFGQDAAVARFFYDDNSVERRCEVISQSLVFQLVLLLVLLPPAWILSSRIASYLSPAPEASVLLRLVLLQVTFLLLINFSQNILKWTFSRRSFLFISIGSTLCSVLALLVAAAAFDLTLVRVFGIYLVTQAMFGLAGLWLVRQWLVWPRDFRWTRPMLIYAIPYGIIYIISAATPALERTLIQEYLGPTELGLFAAGAKVAMLISLPVRAFQVAWGPFSLSIFKQQDAGETYNRVLKAFSVLIFASVLGLTMLATPIIQLLASNRYSGASTLVFAMGFGFAIEAIGWITSIGIGLSKRSYLNLFSYSAFLVVSLGGVYWMMSLFGLPGVAWGVLAGYSAKTAVESRLAQKAYPLPWAYWSVIRLGVLTLTIGAGTQIVRIAFGDFAASTLAGAGFLVVVACGWLLVLDEKDRSAVVRVVKRQTAKREA